jgi:hypothetical protein
MLELIAHLKVVFVDILTLDVVNGEKATIVTLMYHILKSFSQGDAV